RTRSACELARAAAPAELAARQRRVVWDRPVFGRRREHRGEDALRLRDDGMRLRLSESRAPTNEHLTVRDQGMQSLIPELLPYVGVEDRAVAVLSGTRLGDRYLL